MVTVTSYVRYGGVGSRFWCALLQGKSDKYTFNRVFIPLDRTQLSKSGKSGQITATLNASGYYEMNEFVEPSGNPHKMPERRFFFLSESGDLREVSKEDVLSAL